MKGVVVSTRIDFEDFEGLKHVAESDDRSVSYVLRKLIRAAIEEEDWWKTSRLPSTNRAVWDLEDRA